MKEKFPASAEAESKDSILKKAESDANFAQAIAEAGVGTEALGPDELVSRYQSYERSKVALKGVGEVFNEQLEAGFGLKIENLQDKKTAPLESSRKYLSRLAIENPEELEKIITNVDRYNTLKSKISEYDQRLTEIGDAEYRKVAVGKLSQQIEEFKEAEHAAKWATGWRGFLNPKNSELVGWLFRPSRGETIEWARREMRGKATTKESRAEYLGHLRAKIRIFESEKNTLQTAGPLKEKAQEELKALREDFFMNFEGAKDLLALTQGKINEKINKLITEGIRKQDINKLKEAEDYVAMIEQGQEKTGISVQLEQHMGKSPVKKKMTTAEFRDLIGAKITKITEGLIAKRVKEMPAANQALNSLYEDLQKTFEKSGLDEKHRNEMKEFIALVVAENAEKRDAMLGREIKALEKQIANLQNPEWLKMMNKKAGKKGKKRTPTQAKEEIAALEKQKAELEKEKNFKVLSSNLAIMKFLP